MLTNINDWESIKIIIKKRKMWEAFNIYKMKRMWDEDCKQLEIKMEKHLWKRDNDCVKYHFLSLWMVLLRCW